MAAVRRESQSIDVSNSVSEGGEPDALIGHVRFDDRGWETERCRMAQATAPILDSTEAVIAVLSAHVRCWIAGPRVNQPSLHEDPKDPVRPVKVNLANVTGGGSAKSISRVLGDSCPSCRPD
jgi:hypothetical protein